MEPQKPSIRPWSPNPWQVVLFGCVLAWALGTLGLAFRPQDVDESLGPPPADEPVETSWIERSVSFQSGGVTLGGVLTLPPGPGPFPAAVVLSGAGAQDRFGGRDADEARTMPAAFSDAGIALLRTDDRGVGESGGDTSTASYDDLVADAEASMAFLAAQPEIDAQRIGLSGYSQGALIAGLTASRLASDSADERPAVAFLILNSGPGRLGRVSVLEQNATLLRDEGVPEATVQEALELMGRALEITMGPPESPAVSPGDGARGQLRPIVRQLRRLRNTNPFGLGDAAPSVEREIDMLLSTAFREALAYDPGPALRRVRCPVLVIHGELDRQVDPTTELPPVEAALAAAPTDDVTVHLFPGLNHFLEPSATGHMDEYGLRPRSPEVYRTQAAWIADRFSGDTL